MNDRDNFIRSQVESQGNDESMREPDYDMLERQIDGATMKDFRNQSASSSMNGSIVSLSGAGIYNQKLTNLYKKGDN